MLAPKAPPGKSAEDGTRRHKLFEWRVLDIINTPIGEPLSPWPTEYEGFKFLSADIQNISAACDWVEQHRIVEAVRGKEPGFGVAVEQKVEWGPRLGFDLPEDCFGTVDLKLWSPGEQWTVDLKTGGIPVEVVGNLQLFLYSLDGQDERKQYFTILQTTRNPVDRTWAPTMVELHEMTLVCQDAVRRTLVTPLQVLPGERQCKYCTAKPSCGPAQRWMATQLTNVFKEATVTEQLPPLTSVEEIVNTVETESARSPEQLSPEQAARLIQIGPLLTAYVDSVKKHWTEQAVKKGVKVPGMKLVRGRGSRIYVEPEEVVLAKTKGWKIPIDDVAPRKLIGVTALETLCGKHLTELQMRNFNKLIGSKEGKPVLADESDPREEIAPVSFPAVPEESAAPPAAPSATPEFDIDSLI